MRLALNLRYLGGQGSRLGPAGMASLAREAERLGFSAVWVAEAFSSDAPSLLGWLAARTGTIDLGSAVMQIPARSPAATAMTAATLDAVSGGRFRLGLGVSGPQVSEGWHGSRFTAPLGRTREYVEIVRRVLGRDGAEPVVFDGEHYQLPLPDGPGKPLSLGMRPVRRDVPIYLAAAGPRNLELAGEIADGWLAVFFAPEFAADHIRHLAAGRERRGTPASGGFDVVAAVPLVVGEDGPPATDPARMYTAYYLGGMGSRQENFYNRLVARMGYEHAADEVQGHYLSGRIRSAIAAVPDELVDRTSLSGSVGRVADRMRDHAEAGVTTLSLILFARTVADGVRSLRAAADALDKAGVGD